MITKTAYRLSSIRKRYQDKLVLDFSELEIQSGELFAIVGPSGSGKSTLLRIMDFLEIPTSGKLEYFGTEIENRSPLSTRREVGMLFQRPELISGTVRDNIEFPLKIRDIEGTQDIEDLYRQLLIGSLENQNSKNLSGGELQRVALARVLVTHPKVLLLDEPTVNLDPHNVEIIEKTVSELRKDGVTVILVTHNVFQAQRLADRIGLLLNGDFVEISDRKTFFNNPTDVRAKDFVDGKMIY